jgi:hypothetical protein
MNLPGPFLVIIEAGDVAVGAVRSAVAVVAGVMVVAWSSPWSPIRAEPQHGRDKSDGLRRVARGYSVKRQAGN